MIKYKKISQFCKFFPKSHIKAGESLKVGKYPFFTSSDTKICYLDKYIYDDELIVLGTGGSPSCNYLKGRFSVSTDNIVIKPIDEISPRFLYYFLRNDNLSILEKGFRGTGLKHISKEYISNIEVPILDKEIQENIVKMFDNINDIILNEQNKLINFDKMIKSRFIWRCLYAC